MPKRHSSDYGLEITNNSKVGAAFSLPRAQTCISRTAACTKVCYGNGIRYQSHAQKEKRSRNLRTATFLLDNGGPELLAENLLILIDQARPIDWIASTITGTETNIPWTFRIHDIGDFYSVGYAQAWRLAIHKRPHCAFWFYTRSFDDDSMFEALSGLAAEPNCKAWLSLDRDNYELGIMRYCQSASNWKIALLQEQADLMPSHLIPKLAKLSEPGDFLSFPKHHAGRHVEPIKSDNLLICPQVTGSFKLQTRSNMPRPCQSCAICLP